MEVVDVRLEKIGWVKLSEKRRVPIGSKVNKTKKVKNLEKRLWRLQRKVSRKYEKNKKGGSYCKTSNIIKTEKEIIKVHRKLDNIRTDYRHKTTTEIMKNKHLSKAIQKQGFYEFKTMIKYKSEKYGIDFVEADKWYPSSKTCSCCGHIKPKLSLSERTYKYKLIKI